MTLSNGLIDVWFVVCALYMIPSKQRIIVHISINVHCDYQMFPIFSLSLYVQTSLKMETLDNVIFYHIEKAIKSYRQYAQNRIKAAGINMTIDQWLVLKVLMDEPDIQLKDLAVKVFKDNASVTRIVILLEKGKFIEKSVFQTDKRRILLRVTSEGKKIMDAVTHIVLANRQHALSGLSVESVDTTIETLKIISANCNTKA